MAINPSTTSGTEPLMHPSTKTDLSNLFLNYNINFIKQIKKARNCELLNTK